MVKRLPPDQVLVLDIHRERPFRAEIRAVIHKMDLLLSTLRFLWHKALGAF